MEIFLRFYLPAFLVAYLLIVFVVPTVRVYRQTGINPVTFGRTDNAHDYIGSIMKVLTGLLFFAVICFAFQFGYHILNPFEYMLRDWIRYTGLLLIHLSLIWIVVAQAQMKQSWRIGIDEKNKTPLVSNGLFAISRNPVFLGMIVSTVGMFLILPDSLTFFVAVASYLVIQIQIRLEEEFLLKQFSEAYSEYKRSVRRLI